MSQPGFARICGPEITPAWPTGSPQSRARSPVRTRGRLAVPQADPGRGRLPVDPVTVSWEAARRGTSVDPAELAGGYRAFAAGSVVQVYRRAVLARVQQAGLEIQADADDVRLPVASVLELAGEKLAAAERDLAPERCQSPSRGAEVVPLGGRNAGRGRGIQAGV